MTDDGTEAPLRFYGRRKGHKLKKGRQHLMETLLPRLRLDLPAGGPPTEASADAPTLDPAGLFAKPVRAVRLEIGFGGGEHLAHQAAANPDVGFIGCEPFINGVASLLKQADALGLDNLRIFDEDARALLPRLADASLEAIYLLYADPWPKTRHHKRRFLQTETLAQFARLLRPGGEFRFASDHMGYVRWTLAHVMADPNFAWLAETPADWRTRPADAVATRYEAKALEKDIPCVYLRFERCGAD